MNTTAIEWTPPNGGYWRRDFRLAEWLPAPVTTSFASWILPEIEAGFADAAEAEWGMRMTLPMHVIVNGWYFTTDPKAKGMASAVLRHPRKMIGTAVGMATMGQHPERVQRWMSEPARRRYIDTVLPAHRTRIASATAEVGDATPTGLVAVIDELARSTGTLMLPMVQTMGFAGKAEFALATFHAKHLRERVTSSHLDLLVGLITPAPPPAHGVYSLDWAEPTVGERPADRVGHDTADHARAHERLVAQRIAAEHACRDALASEPKLLTRFDQLLAIAQDAIPVRDAMVTEFTEAWPVLRSAALRLGAALAANGSLVATDDIWFLQRDEITSAISNAQPDLAGQVAERRNTRSERDRLAPPLGIGKPSGPWKRMDKFTDVFQPPTTENSTVRGIGTSTGVATGTVRIIRSLDDFDDFLQGEVLVAPVTTPAWTPLFCLAAAVVTDGGSPFAHAAVVAREYGIPAVVGTGDATARLHTGQTVTVDGAAGTVTITA